ncbi:GAF domain-containing protein [Pseudomonas aeruginosa]|uniref:GAF domain-containing protein n=1 Tax=Pseudomonas aeruginosa TaxID=287 RepID=UPI0012986635|nr:GAF domain-containing protein [Pseudomonas aeruginosa]
MNPAIKPIRLLVRTGWRSAILRPHRTRMVTSKRMKGFSQTRKLLYIASEYAYALGVFASAVLGVATGADLDSNWLSNRPIVSRVVEVAQDYAIPAYIIICTVIATSFIYRRKGDPWIWEKLKFILDEYQGKAFIKEAGDPSDHHRITLFKHEKNCLFVKHWSSTKTLKPWGRNPILSNYLVPVLRSGHLSQKSGAKFYVSDNSDDCESVAAQAWSSNQAIIVDNLPLINANQKRSRDISTYATKTYCAKEMVEKYVNDSRPLPRSIAAIPVMVKGEIWGVVVLDSRSPNGVTSESVIHYELTVALIGQLLEKAK